jgi:hypothetical protein
MKPFAPPKRKLIELVIMMILAGVFYVIYPEMDSLVLFLFGFIWNWSASNDLSVIFENRRNRMSMLKLVVNLQNLFLKPFSRAPEIIKKIVKVFPAGIFWFLVIYINNSEMPWWSTFIGSIAFELLQFELDFFNRRKEIP